MNEIAERYRKVADGMTKTARAVPPDAWDNAAPARGGLCVHPVRHMVEWIPGFLRSGSDVDLPEGPSVDDDPVGVWQILTDGIQRVLEDPQSADGQFEHPRAGRHSVEDAIATFFLGDVLIHTWDLAVQPDSTRPSTWTKCTECSRASSPTTRCCVRAVSTGCGSKCRTMQMSRRN